MTKYEMEAADARAEKLGESFEVPNLDGFSICPGDYAGLERVFDRLALYCHDKRHAMKLRAAGDIEAAVAYERKLEQTYKKLPKWARW